MRKAGSIGVFGLAVGIAAVAVSLAAQAVSEETPEAVVNRQVDAFNRHDLDAFLGTYGDRISLYTLGSQEVRRSKGAMRDAISPMFGANPNLKSQTLKRVGFGPFVVDREQLSGVANMPPVVILSIYEVRNGHIVNYWQSPIAPPKAGDPPAADPDPDAVATVDRSLAAFNKHNAAAAADAYGDQVAAYTLTVDSAARTMTREQMQESIAQSFQHGAHPHAVVRDQLLVGPYVARRLSVTGLPDGRPAGKLEVAFVQNGRIVAQWDTP